MDDFLNTDDNLIDEIILPKKTPERVLFTVGSVLRGDDAAGPYLAKLFNDNPIDGWTLVEGDQTPENEIGYLRRMHPDTILMIDAADMGLEPGSVRKIKKEDVKTSFLFTTHSMPITHLLSQLENACNNLIFIGIQPAHTEFFGPLTPKVKDSVMQVYYAIHGDRGFDEISPLS